MRRQDIQLLALARQGDSAARCEAGRRYLLGVDGFPQHTASGLDHLNRVDAALRAQAARIIAESLALEELVTLQQEDALARAAADGSAAAQVKLGAWLVLRRGRVEEGVRWVDRAAAAGHEAARQAVAALRRPDAEEPMAAFLQVLAEAGVLDAAPLALLAARQARAEGDLRQLAASLRIALALRAPVEAEIAELLAAAVQLAEAQGRPLLGLPVEAIELALELRSHRGDRDAAHALGRALCGIACGVLAPEALAGGQNMRKGVALLLRAADAGCDAAWMQLYRVHGDHRLSVANPQMARFCLEKSALAGDTEAQRKLGALMLRAATTLADTEAAITWLHQAAAKDDAHAVALLHSLVLPLPGDDATAEAAIERVREDDPWVALRMALARHYGLTKLEALCVDPADGLRPWGLVVGRNPFISQIRLSAARAIPALDEAALDALRRAAAFYAHAQREAPLFEGDLRRRTRRVRRAFERHGVAEAMFFAQASATTLEALRLGSKWAFRAREPLQSALAD